MKGKEASEVELWHDGGWQVIEFSGLIAKMISTTIMSLPRITGRKDMGGGLELAGRPIQRICLRYAFTAIKGSMQRWGSGKYKVLGVRGTRICALDGM